MHPCGTRPRTGFWYRNPSNRHRSRFRDIGAEAGTPRTKKAPAFARALWQTPRSERFPTVELPVQSAITRKPQIQVGKRINHIDLTVQLIVRSQARTSLAIAGEGSFCRLRGSAETPAAEAELTRFVGAWSDLPDAVRTGIQENVEASQSLR